VAVLRDHFEGLRVEAERLAAGPPDEAIVAWLEAVLATSALYRGMGAAVMIALMDAASELRAACDGMRAAGAALLTTAQEAGAIRPDVTLADVLLLVHGIGWAAERAPAAGSGAARLLTLALEGLRTVDRRE
jgi:hypothetical protein